MTDKIKKIVVQPRDAEMLRMYLIERKTTREIGAHFGRSHARMHQRLHDDYKIVSSPVGPVVTRPDLVCQALPDWGME